MSVIYKKGAFDSQSGPAIRKNSSWTEARVGREQDGSVVADVVPSGVGDRTAKGCCKSGDRIRSNDFAASWTTYSVGTWSFRIKGFDSTQASNLMSAISYLNGQIAQDIAGRSSGSTYYVGVHPRKNCQQSCPCLHGSNNKAWGGDNSGSPAQLIDDAFTGGKLRFRFRKTGRHYVSSSGSSGCKKRKCSYCTSSASGGAVISKTNAYVKCHDHGDAPGKKVKIRICELAVDAMFITTSLAATIAHEVLHGLGADEHAVRQMDPNRAGYSGTCSSTC